MSEKLYAAYWFESALPLHFLFIKTLYWELVEIILWFILLIYLHRNSKGLCHFAPPLCLLVIAWCHSIENTVTSSFYFKCFVYHLSLDPGTYLSGYLSCIRVHVHLSWVYKENIFIKFFIIKFPDLNKVRCMLLNVIADFAVHRTHRLEATVLARLKDWRLAAAM